MWVHDIRTACDILNFYYKQSKDAFLADPFDFYGAFLNKLVSPGNAPDSLNKIWASHELTPGAKMTFAGAIARGLIFEASLKLRIKAKIHLALRG